MTGALLGSYRTANSDLNPLKLFSDNFPQNLRLFFRFFWSQGWFYQLFTRIPQAHALKLHRFDQPIEAGQKNWLDFGSLIGLK